MIVLPLCFCYWHIVTIFSLHDPEAVAGLKLLTLILQSKYFTTVQLLIGKMTNFIANFFLLLSLAIDGLEHLTLG